MKIPHSKAGFGSMAAFLAACAIAWPPADGEDLPDLSQFKPLKTDSGGPVFFEDFNEGLNGWTNPGNSFTWRNQEGMVGTGCVLAERDTYDGRDLHIQKKIPLKHGIRYRLRVHYRTEMKEDPLYKWKAQEYFCIRYLDPATEKTIYAAVDSETRHEPDSKPDWTEWSHDFYVPEIYSSTVLLELRMHSRRLGKVWIDDVSIEPAEAIGATLFPVRNSEMTYDPEAGITYFMKLPLNRQESDFRLLVEAGGIKKMLEPKNGYANGTFGRFPGGTLHLKATLLDMPGKAVFGVDESVLYVRDVENIPGRIVVEPDGRMIRDGKPFLPVGVYAGYNRPSDTNKLQRIRDAGFNCVEQVWSHAVYTGKKNTAKETLLASVREMAKYDLGFLCAIKYQIPQSKGKIESVDGVEGLDNVTRYIIDAIKREPNLIGYYVADENPIDQLPAIRHLRRLTSELDPWHPTMTLTCRDDHFLLFADSGDYLMFDSYPVGYFYTKDSPRQSMALSHKSIKMIRDAGAPFVWVPQIFNWNAEIKILPVRYPTAKEVRSMVLLGAVYEARAYFFYAYHCIFYQSENVDEQWANASQAARLISSLSPWLLSCESAPKAEVKQISGAEVAARAFVHEGKPLVIITADGPDECEAEITVPGVTGLKSRYGNTEEVSPGVYRFKGLHIDSDVLGGE